MFQFQSKKSAFSLIELLISISILFILFTIVNTGFVKKQRGMEFEVAHDGIYNALFEARENSRNFKNDSVYGILLNNDWYVLFKGDTYTVAGTITTVTLRDFLEINSLSLNGGGNEIVFEKNTGKTEDYGSFKMVSDDGEIMWFEITQQGFINLTYSEI